MFIVLFVAFWLLLALVVIGYNWVMSESEYKSYGLPWYKRPAAFWYIVIAGLIVGIFGH